MNASACNECQWRQPVDGVYAAAKTVTTLMLYSCVNYNKSSAKWRIYEFITNHDIKMADGRS